MNTLQSFPFHLRPAILIIGSCAALGACQASDEADVANDAGANEAVLNLPTVLPQPPMGRAALLSAVARAASATAAGLDDAEAQRRLDGTRFEVRIRFGCRGPAPDLSEAIFGWTADRETGTLRVRATPTISTENPIVQKVAGEDVEAAEGFWIPRPWLLEPVCPAAAAVRPAPAAPEIEAEAEGDAQPPSGTRPTEPPQSATPAEDQQETRSPPPAWPKIGIAHFFTSSDARTRRRGTQPYETVKNLEPNQPIGSQGYNLVLSGRLRALPGKGVIACVNTGAENPPDCIVSADLDRVWIERPENREILAEWGSG